jgi:hypothetical protein
VLLTPVLSVAGLARLTYNRHLLPLHEKPFSAV